MNTRAADIMSTELLTATEDITLEEALKVMINSRITGMPIVDDAGKMVGVLSEYDLIEQVAQGKGLKPELFKKKAKHSTQAFSISEEMPLQEIVDIFVKQKFRRVPVVNKGGQLVGIITRRDLMRIFYYRSQLGPQK